MNALDTNVLVRFLVQDDEKQAGIVNTLINQAEVNKQPLFITLLVVIELIWVLESVYAVTREDILHSLNELLSMPALVFEKQKAVRQFIAAASGTTFDLSDLLIAYSGVEAGCETTFTFDKKAARADVFQRL